MNNEFIIKINSDSHGNQLSLDNITIEAADALMIMIESLTNIAKLYDENPDIKISLKNGSIESCLVYPSTGNLIQEEIENIILGNSDNNEKIKFFKTIQDKIKSNGLDYTVINKVNDEIKDLTVIFKSNNFPLKRVRRTEFYEKVEFIQGRLYESGGKVKTNIHLENTLQEEYKVECTQEQAIEINQRLYSNIYLSVLKKWRLNQKPTYQLIDSYLSEDKFINYKTFYNDIKNNPTLDRFDLVYNRIVEIIESDEINNGEILKIMRLYNNPNSDRGIIRTILMTLKPVISKNTNLSVMYNSLAKILRAGNPKNKI